MNIAKKIKVERKKRGLTQSDLKDQLLEKADLETSLGTIQNWENENKKEPGLIEIQCLCEVFSIPISSFLDLNLNEITDTDEDLLQHGKLIKDYTELANYHDLMSLFFVCPIDYIDMVPRYDIELSKIRSQLSNNKIGSVFSTLATFFYWIEQCREEKSFADLKVKIQSDSVGCRSLHDHRLIFEPLEFELMKEGLSAELYWFAYNLSQVSLQKTKSSNSINGLTFVKKNRYS